MTPPTLMLVTEPPRIGFRPLEETVEAAVSGGVDAVLLRDKEAPAERLLATAERLRRLTQGKARLFVHTNASVARAARADGRHCSASALRTSHGRLPAADMTLGYSVHTVEEARRAASRGAEYLLGGTIFPSSSHPELEPAGLAVLGALCGATPVPVLAIGGVVPENAAACLQAGAAGVAALSSLMRAADPEAMARSYRRALESATALSFTVNGRAALLPKPTSIADFLARRGLAAEVVAVEHNREIVPRSRYAEIMIAPGDTLEIVRMMAGG